MLYLTTRNKIDSYTAHRVFCSDYPPGGGFFVPYRIPVFSEEQVLGFKDLSFSESIAYVLNTFFGSHINGWDVDFAIGRKAVQLAAMSHRIFLLETWHNPEGTYRHMASRLSKLVHGGENSDAKDSIWFCTALDIALLFGAYGALLRREISAFNMAVPAGDLQLLTSLRFAQRMGLPVQNIAMAASEREDLWDFLQQGSYRTDRDRIPSGLEQLLYLHFGLDEVLRFLDAVKNRKTYRLTPEQLAVFSEGLCVHVVGKNRIQSVQHSCEQPLSADAAYAYAALQDYRVQSADGLDTVLFSFKKP